MLSATFAKTISGLEAANTQSSFSLVTTVLNDLGGVKSFLQQMCLQTSQPAEIVVVDAGSKDGTWELLQAEASQTDRPWVLRALQELGCNIARGRNLAIVATTHEIILSTDIGCIWEPEWCAELLAPLLSDASCEAVMGSWQVWWGDQSSAWAQSDPLLCGQLELRATADSLASSRAIAYRKGLWAQIGGYPEDLTLAADDTVFVLILHETTKDVASAPIPRCRWVRPQRFNALVREARRNFRGNAEAGIWLKYLVLAGGRVFAEWLCLIGTLLSVIIGWQAPVAWCFAAFLLLLLAWRSQCWIQLWISVRKQGGKSYFWQVASLDYAARLWALCGCLEGLLHGAKCCRDCRRRVRAAGIGWW